MGWCSSVPLAFIVCYEEDVGLFSLDFDQVILINKRHNSDKYTLLENSPKKARALIGLKSCLYNSMEIQN